MGDRKQVYGKRKEFIFDHWHDICQMRKRMSAERVCRVYGGVINVSILYKYERIEKKYEKSSI